MTVDEVIRALQAIGIAVRTSTKVKVTDKLGSFVAEIATIEESDDEVLIVIEDFPSL